MFRMKTLEYGNKAPDIQLPLLGGGKFSLSQSLANGQILLAFFKISCPVCQYTFPFLERLANRTKGKGLQVIGISQDDAKSTGLFCKEYGVTFPVALDETGMYPASNAYGLTYVPTLFLIAENGDIEKTVVGWLKADIDAIDADFTIGSATSPLFRNDEQVAEFRAG
jgi:peroxiredoxin